MKEDNVYKMNLHDTMRVPETKMQILRVPNGWIYRDLSSGSQCFVPEHGTLVVESKTIGDEEFFRIT